jgi:RNA polymerase sigma-70 factor (ECF subfamily)
MNTATVKTIKDPSKSHTANPEEEALWIQAIANGDRNAFRLLHERYRAILFFTIHKVLGNYEDSEDVLQEVYAKIWSKASLFDSERGKPLTWATTMARNRAIDRYRSKQRRSSLGERYETQVDVERDRDRNRNSTEQDVIDNETSSVLRSAVLELTPGQREAIDLAYFGGLTQNEVAERTGQPLGTVKARIRRGIERLEKKVRDRV